MVRNAVALHQAEEILGAIPRQCRLGEVRIPGEEILGACIEVGEVATPSSGDQDLSANLRVMLRHHNPASPLTGFDGAHQAGSTRPDHNYIDRLLVAAPGHDTYSGRLICWL